MFTDWSFAPPRFEPGLLTTHGGFTTGDLGVSPDRTRTGWRPQLIAWLRHHNMNLLCCHGAQAAGRNPPTTGEQNHCLTDWAMSIRASVASVRPLMSLANLARSTSWNKKRTILNLHFIDGLNPVRYSGAEYASARVPCPGLLTSSLDKLRESFASWNRTADIARPHRTLGNSQRGCLTAAERGKCLCRDPTRDCNRSDR